MLLRKETKVDVVTIGIINCRVSVCAGDLPVLFEDKYPFVVAFHLFLQAIPL